MDLRIGQLSEGCFVCGQIEPGDMPDLAAKGIKSIINNRPGGEQWGQPATSEIEDAAAKQGPWGTPMFRCSRIAGQTPSHLSGPDHIESVGPVRPVGGCYDDFESVASGNE